MLRISLVASLACLGTKAASFENSEYGEDMETWQFPSGHDPYRWFLNFLDPNIRPKHYHVRENIAPIEGHIAFPNISGKYPWIDVQHGFLGEFPEMVYSEWLGTLAALGFVVTYAMPHNTNVHDFAPADNFTAWDTWNKWVKDNANEYIKAEAGIYDLEVEVDTSKLAMICHADGCDMTKEFMIQDPNRADGWFFLDPVYSVDNVDTPVTLSGLQTVVVAQTDMCSRCCEASNNFDTRTYDSISGMNIKTYQQLYEKGHCSVFNYWFNDNCRKSRYCEMPRDQMNVVRRFHRDLTGWVTAQMTYSFFDRSDMKKYFTNENRFPSDFLAGDIQCESDAFPNAC